MGINKMQVKNRTRRNINGDHMVAGSERNKRWDFTINGNRVRDQWVLGSEVWKTQKLV